MTNLLWILAIGVLFFLIMRKGGCCGGGHSHSKHKKDSEGVGKDMKGNDSSGENQSGCH